MICRSKHARVMNSAASKVIGRTGPGLAASGGDAGEALRQEAGRLRADEALQLGPAGAGGERIDGRRDQDVEPGDGAVEAERQDGALATQLEIAADRLAELVGIASGVADVV